MAGLVSNDGKFISTTEFFAGKGVFEANPLVVEKLQEVGNLLKVEKNQTQLPTLLASQNPDYFPCNPTMVYRYGNTRFTPTSIR